MENKKRVMNRNTVKKRLDELELVGVIDIAKLLNWSAPKVTTYINRGKLPEAIAEISGRPVWYKPEIIKISEDQGWKIHEDNINWVDPYKTDKKKDRVTA